MLLISENSHDARCNHDEIKSEKQICNEAQYVDVKRSAFFQDRVAFVLTVETFYSFGGPHSEILHFALCTLQPFKNDCSFAHHSHHFKLRELRLGIDLLTACLLALKHKLFIEFRSDFIFDLLLYVLNPIYNLASNLLLLLYPLLLLIHGVIRPAIRLNYLFFRRFHRLYHSFSNRCLNLVN